MRRDRYPTLADFCLVADRDEIVFVGDIGAYTHTLQFNEDEARISPVIYVPGDHDYHTEWGRGATCDCRREIADQTPNLRYLNGEGVSIGGDQSPREGLIKSFLG